MSEKTLLQEFPLITTLIDRMNVNLEVWLVHPLGPKVPETYLGRPVVVGFHQSKKIWEDNVKNAIKTK